MPRPAQLQKYWDEHPEMLGKTGAGRKRRDFPETGTLTEQLRWMRQEFLKCANEIIEPVERASLLKHVLLTIKVPKAGPATDPKAAYAEHLAKLAEAQEKKLEAERGKKG